MEFAWIYLQNLINLTECLALKEENIREYIQIIKYINQMPISFSFSIYFAC